MADTTIDGQEPAVVEVGTTKSTLTLEKDREYTLFHTGLQDDGSTADTNDIFYSVAADPTASYEGGTNKGVIQSEKAVVVGPGVTDVRVITATGDPVLLVQPGAVNTDNIRA